MIIAILALKLYIGYKRFNNRISRIIRINEENAVVQYGCSEHLIKTLRKYKIDKGIWSDNIGEILEKIKISIENEEEGIKMITKNLIIMDYATKYVKELNLSNKILAFINHVRLFKSIILPYELVGLEGMCRIYEMRNLMEKSCIRWKIEFSKIPKPSKKLL